MKKLLVLFVAIFVLSLSLVSAYDLEVVSLQTSGSLVADQDIVFNVVVRNVEDLYNISQGQASLSLNVGEGSPTSFDIDANLANGETREFSITHQYATKGTYNVQAEITQPSGHNDTDLTNDNKNLSVIIINTAPILETIADQTIVSGNNFQYQTVASDNDDDSLTYTIESTTLGSSITIDAFGLITYTNANNINTHSVTVTVNDGTTSTSKTFTLEVLADIPSFTFDTTKLNVGSNTQEREESVNTQFSITNDGTQTLTSFVISNDIPSEFDPIVSFDTATPLTAGQSRTGTLIITIPENQNSESEEIGKLTIEAQAGSIQISRSIDVDVEAESMLKIENIEIDASEDDDSSIDDGDRVDFLKEGDEIEMIIKVENTYKDDDDYDFEIENVYVEVEAANDDWFNNEESSEADIKAEDDNKFKISLTLDDDLDDDDVKVYVRAYGDDKEFDFEHYDEWEITFEIERETHEITIKNVELVNSGRYNNDETFQYISCDQRDATIELKVKNTGKKDEDEVYIRVESDDLDFDMRKINEEIDEGDSENYKFTFPIPNGLNVDDIYDFKVETFYDTDKDSDEEEVLVKYVCESSSSSSSSNNNNNNNIVTTTPTTNDDTTSNIVDNINNNNGIDFGNIGDMVQSKPKGEFDAFRSSTTYLILLLLVVLFLLGIIAYLGSIALKKK